MVIGSLSCPHGFLNDVNKGLNAKGFFDAGCASAKQGGHGFLIGYVPCNENNARPKFRPVFCYPGVHIGAVEMAVFLAILLIGYFYAWKRKVLSWV